MPTTDDQEMVMRVIERIARNARHAGLYEGVGLQQTAEVCDGHVKDDIKWVAQLLGYKL